MTAALAHQPCPDCGSSDALAVYEDHSHCFSCQAYHPLRESEVSKVETAPLPLIPQGDLRYADLPGRGITADTCRRWGYGLARYRDATVQVATYRDARGEPVAQKLRFPDKRFSVLGDLSAARLYGANLWGATGRMVVVTEGEVDALAVSQLQDHRWPVVSVPSGAASAASALRREVEWLCGFDRVVIAFDADDPGRAGAAKAAEVLPPGKAYLAELPAKDPADCLKAGLGQALRSAFWNARPWRPDGVLTGADAWARAASSPDAPAYPWGLPVLDDRTGGYRLGEVAVLTGGTGSGKTTLVQQVVADRLSAGGRVGLVSLESPLRRIVLDLCSVLRAVPRQEELDEENRSAWARVEDRVSVYQHFGSTDPDVILSRMRYMVTALGCEVLVLDHLSMIVSGSDVDADERRTIDRIMTRVATLAQELQVPILVVSHLRRPKEGSHEEGARVTLSDLRGSGAIGQLAHTVLAVERDQQDPDGSALIRVLKCRHVGRLGPADEVRYDRERSRLVPATAAGYGL